MKSFTIGGFVTAGFLATLMIGCGTDARNVPGEVAVGTRESPPQTDSTVAAPPPTDEGDGVVLFLGTSLTAGLGLPQEAAYPSLVGQRLAEAGLPFRAVNAGVSGETSAGALRRIDSLLAQPFEILVLETGANDMLRGISPAELESNIQSIIDRVRERRPDARIILAGMRAAPNLGPQYVARFEAVYPRLAERNDLALIPFVLEGVAGEPTLNLDDGMHPNAEGQRQLARNVWEVLEPVAIEEAEARGE